jgi:pseudaminic acid cytidylyltransferase
MIVAIIPARSGSVRIKNKNIKNFLKKPMISYAINVAKKSKLFDKIVVSTDSNHIGLISKKNGADVFIKRPKKISGNKTSTRAVILHAINWLKKNYITPSFICCIYPATPLLSYLDLIKAFKIIKSKKSYDYVFSATKNSFPLERCFSLKENGGVKMLNKKNYFKNSQDFQDTYRDAGQFYWGSSESWINKKIIFSKKSRVYLLSQFSVHDINTYEDWRFVEKLYKIKNIKI